MLSSAYLNALDAVGILCMHSSNPNKGKCRSSSGVAVESSVPYFSDHNGLHMRDCNIQSKVIGGVLGVLGSAHNHTNHIHTVCE